MKRAWAAALAVVVAMSVTSCAQNEPKATQTLVAVSSTVLNINVVGCEGCIIRLANAVQGRQGSVEATVKNGRASIEVPTKSTPGLTFAIGHPQGLAINGKTSIAVVAYPDIPAGQSLASSAAAAKTTGSVCWIGTNQATVGLRIVVEVTPDEQLRTRFSPTGEMAGPSVELTQGGYGSDETPDCSRV